MKNKILIYPQLIVILLVILLSGCEKDNNSNEPIVEELEYGTVSDIDGNVYETVKIGNQWWMTENLRTTKYNDGSEIPHDTNNEHWGFLTTGAYCYYNNDDSNKDTYGALYNWKAVNTGKLAPTGWHVPNHSDFKTLIQYLDENSDITTITYFNTSFEEISSAEAGGKLKEEGTTHWNTPNYGATNESGFNAIGGGVLQSGKFEYIKEYGSFWCSTPVHEFSSYRLLITNDYSDILYGPETFTIGMSVRCVKD